MESCSPTAAVKIPTRRIPMSDSPTRPIAAYRARRTRLFTRWTRGPVKSCGRAATKSLPGTIGPGFPWPTAASTSQRSIATCTASASRSSSAFMLRSGSLLSGANALAEVRHGRSLTVAVPKELTEPRASASGFRDELRLGRLSRVVAAMLALGCSAWPQATESDRVKLLEQQLAAERHLL